MKRYSTKILASFVLLAGVLFLGQSAFVGAAGGNGPGPCDATAYNVSGWLWSDGAGWISLNCSNSASTSAMNFGVYQDQAGFWQGYGWSSNFGWLHFDPNPSDGTSTSGCPSNNGGILKYDGTTNASVCKTQLFDFGNGNKQLVGFARFISSPTASDPDDWSWVSWSCRNDHNFAGAGVQVSPHCGSGANIYGPAAGTPVTGPTGDVSTIKGFGWGRLNVGWMEFKNVTVTTDPDAIDLVLSPSSTTVYSPYEVKLSWTSSKADKFTADKCTAFARKTGETASLPTTNWVGNTNLLPPTATVTTQSQANVAVAAQSVDYKIDCKTLTGQVLSSNWTTVTRGNVPIVLNQSCKDESTVRLSWSYLGSGQSCRLFKDGSRVATGLLRNDGRDVTTDGAYDVKCYDPANAADNAPISTSNIESVSIASCATCTPDTTYAQNSNCYCANHPTDTKCKTCTSDTTYAESSTCFCYNHPTDGRCTRTIVAVAALCSDTVPSARVSWNAVGGTATSCRLFKNGVRIDTGLSLSGAKDPVSSGSYQVKCYDSASAADSAAVGASSSISAPSQATCTTCTPSTMYTENPACFCRYNSTDTRCAPQPPITTPTKPGVTEDKNR